ncbi:MAG: hypothetical protein IKB20_01505 [Clostridia bacterium]|nr:hypothetical protein [Clostridia bacterium]
MKNNPLKNKRGMVLATAVMFMTVLAFMGILLTSMLLYSTTIARTNNKLFQNRLTLDQIGEYFVAGTLTDAQLEEYGYEDVNAQDNILALKKKDGTNVVLYIEKDGTTAKIWRYSDK